MDEHTLDVLVAKQAIADVLHDYCRAMDRIDHELARSVFHDDATVDYGDMFRGSGHGFVDWVMKNHEALLTHTHQLANVVVRVADDRAASESYVTARLRGRGADGSLFDIETLGRYVDRWERRVGRWAIVERSYVHEMDDTRPVALAGFATAGRRDRSDLSYAALGELDGAH